MFPLISRAFQKKSDTVDESGKNLAYSSDFDQKIDALKDSSAKKWDLSRNDIGRSPSASSHMGAALAETRVPQVDLSGNSFDDSTFPAIAVGLKNSSARSINLSETVLDARVKSNGTVSTETIDTLAHALLNTKVKEVDLSHNFITSADRNDAQQSHSPEVTKSYERLGAALAQTPAKVTLVKNTVSSHKDTVNDFNSMIKNSDVNDHLKVRKEIESGFVKEYRKPVLIEFIQKSQRILPEQKGSITDILLERAGDFSGDDIKMLGKAMSSKKD